MSLFDKFQHGLPYRDFLARYANPGQAQRWGAIYQAVALTPSARCWAAFVAR